MNQVDGVSDTVSLLCGSVWGRAQKGDNAAAWLLEFRLSPSTRPNASHFSFSPYATGTLPAAAPVPEPRGSEYA